MGLGVKLPNAFSINKLGLEGTPFPLGVSCNQSDTGVFSMYLYPQRLVDMFDLLHGFEMCIVFGVGHKLSNPNHPQHTLNLAEIVDSVAIDCTVVDANTIAISTGELMRLLSILPQHDLCMFDMPRNSSQDDVITNMLNYDEVKLRKNRSQLPHLTNSSVFLNSHDDCYLTLESYDTGLLQQVFERALQTYVGTFLLGKLGVDEIEVREVPFGLLNILWPKNAHLTILPEETEITESEVKIGVSRQQFDLRVQQALQVDIVISYNCATQIWNPTKPQ
ncbi:MAG: hypothetical protein JEZ00_20580 [Anaerolineaceae bacterium]|nr:hypothetical protein [Anaerolineaceae bacterium]